MVQGAGERSAKNLLTSPGLTRPDCSPWWGAVAHLADTCSKKSAHRFSLYRRLFACTCRAVSTVQLVRIVARVRSTRRQGHHAVAAS